VRPDDAGGRRRARQPRELGVAGEACDASDLADQLGRDQRPATRISGKPRRERDDERGKLLLEVIDRAREIADAVELIARNTDARGLLGSGQAPGEALRPTLTRERAQRDLQLGPEVVQLPAQIVDQCGALLDEAIAVIDEQPDVELDARQVRDGQRLKALADRRSRDRDGIDSVRLARLARALPRAGHQLRRNANHALAALEQEPLQRPRDMPAILKRPHPLATDAARPAHSSPNERGAAATVTSPSARPVASSTAASVCERLWVSAPITIISTVPLSG
jgi:hypothetical protein